MIRKLAHAYVENYQRHDRLYNLMRDEGIYIEEISDPYTVYVEAIFDEHVGKDFCSALIQFAEEGSVHLCSPDRDITDLDELIDIYLK